MDEGEDALPEEPEVVLELAVVGDAGRDLVQPFPPEVPRARRKVVLQPLVDRAPVLSSLAQAEEREQRVIAQPRDRHPLQVDQGDLRRGEVRRHHLGARG